MINAMKLYKKNVDELSEDEIIFIHLNNNHVQMNDKPLHSTLAITLRGVNATWNNIYQRTLIPLVSLFAVLEQLGNAYDNSNIIQDNKTNPIYRCIKNLAIDLQISLREIDALIAFRNLLFHEISIAGSSRSIEDKRLKYFYFNTSDSTSYLIKHPEIEWNGDYNELSPKNTTIISRERLKDLAEHCVLAAEELRKEKQLKIKGEVKEFLYKYLIVHKY